ncbi:uncharacterized protein [Henckelia pumila]|uniref:uncharacterized protein isoform X2 n=1 Tax=Henckelia pumila TaxID=405737 RepID=UPI003C6E396E
MDSNIFVKYYNKVRLNDIEGDMNTGVYEILQYMKEVGLRGTSAAWNPRKRNIHAFFCQEVYRKLIYSYKKLSMDEAFRISSRFPVIATFGIKQSFNRNFNEIIYLSKEIEEKYIHIDEEVDNLQMVDEEFEEVKLHTMLVVGNATLNHNDETLEFLLFTKLLGNRFWVHGICTDAT